MYISQQQLDLVKWQRKHKHKDKDWVLDTKSKLGIMSIYITLISLLKRTGINLKIHHSIPLGILRMLNKLQEYPKIYYSKTHLPNSTLRGFKIKPSIFICGNLLNQQVF